MTTNLAAEHRAASHRFARLLLMYAVGASEGLINWLKQSDCESVYCREVEPKDVEGAAVVPEFQHYVIAAGEKEFGSRELARKWLTVNLSDELRSGFLQAAAGRPANIAQAG